MSCVYPPTVAGTALQIDVKMKSLAGDDVVRYMYVHHASLQGLKGLCSLLIGKLTSI